MLAFERQNVLKLKLSSFFFDLDGTLVDSRQDLTNSANVTRKYFGLSEIDIKTLSNYVGDGINELVKRLLPSLSEEKIALGVKIFKEYYSKHCVDNTKPYPDVIEMLEYYKDKTKAVITNKVQSFSCKILEKLDMLKYFDLVLGGDSTPLIKPDSMPLEGAISLLNLDKKNIIMVGDGPTDIKAGKNAGILTCAVTYGLKERSFLEKLKPDFMIDKIMDMTNLFE